jgi:diacylglycerol kinase family enzyme
VEHDAVTFIRTKHLSVSSEPGTPAHTDGEIISESVTEAAYQVLANKVALLCPKPK